jgi:hypothetical protein
MVTKLLTGLQIPRGWRSSSEDKISTICNRELETSPPLYDIFTTEMSVKSI